MILPMLSGLIPCVVAQNLSIPVGQQAAELQGSDIPQRGMMQTTVEVRFGAPLLKADPVGEPPVSKWEYAGYHVYFERDRVIHTVLKHKQ
jgi:hypothetical protein